MKRDDTDGRDEALLGPLAEAARRVAAEDAGAGPTPAAWHRLRQARDGGRARAPRRWVLPVVAAAGLALAAGGWLARRPRPLTFVVAGGQVEANGYVLGAGPAATELRFSDGTRVRLERGCRMSVGAPGPHGARLRVEDGRAHFEVVHRPGADWSVEVGPYRVQVTGTVFDVRWSSAEEAAAVALRAGSVRVTGPHLEAPLALAAGQRLVASLATSAVKLEAGSLDDAPPGERPAGAMAPSVPIAPPHEGAPPAQLPATAAREVHELTEELHPADIAHILEGLPVEDRLWVWGLVGPEREGDVLLEVSDAVRDTLLADMDNAEIVAATQDLDADEIADLAPDLPDEVVQGIIEAQDVEDRAQLQTALSYQEGTVGSLMDFEVVSIRDDVDCEAALQYLRRFDELPGHTDAVFVVDRDGRLKGSLALNRLLVSNPDVEVSGLYDSEVAAFRPESDADETAAAYLAITPVR